MLDFLNSQHEFFLDAGGSGNLELLKQLRQQYPTDDGYLISAIRDASRNGHVDIIKWFLEDCEVAIEQSQTYHALLYTLIDNANGFEDLSLLRYLLFDSPRADIFWTNSCPRRVVDIREAYQTDEKYPAIQKKKHAREKLQLDAAADLEQFLHASETAAIQTVRQTAEKLRQQLAEAEAQLVAHDRMVSTMRMKRQRQFDKTIDRLLRDPVVVSAIDAGLVETIAETQAYAENALIPRPSRNQRVI